MAAVRWFSLFVMCAAQSAFGGAVAAEETAPQEITVADPAAASALSIRVLSDNDAALYKEIFALQEDGRWKEADAKIAALENDVLMGYVQYQRYMHPTAYRSTFSELKRWMSYYADHPEADKIYSLARKRQPRGQASPVRPISRKWRSEPEKELHPDLEADYDKKSRSNVRRIEGRVRYL